MEKTKKSEQLATTPYPVSTEKKVTSNDHTFVGLSGCTVYILLPLFPGARPIYHTNVYEKSIVKSFEPALGKTVNIAKKFSEGKYPIVISGVDMFDFSSTTAYVELFNQINTETYIGIDTDLRAESIIPVYDFIMKNPGVISALHVHRKLGLVEHECSDIQLAQLSHIVPIVIVYEDVSTWSKEELDSAIERWYFDRNLGFNIEVNFIDHPYEAKGMVEGSTAFDKYPKVLDYRINQYQQYRLMEYNFQRMPSTNTKYWYIKEATVSYQKLSTAYDGFERNDIIGITTIVVAPDGKRLCDFDYDCAMGHSFSIL